MMETKELIQKIMQKKEFSQLPLKDVEIAFSHFERREVSEEEKIRLTRELLHKVFGSFTSEKLLSPKNKDAEWILRKHLSTRERMGINRSPRRGQTRGYMNVQSSSNLGRSGERLPYYKQLYERLLKGFEKISIIDLGCGVNGFSYSYFNSKINYTGIESIGQLVDLTNNYFKKEKIKGRVYHLSLFELEKVKEIIRKTGKSRIVFLFKVLDSLEMLKPDYSKKLLEEIVPLADKIVISFATRSMVKREKFKVNRNWIINFVKETFNVLDDFELGEERYIVIKKK